ncbi:cilia- and flagella-associated protein 299-like [Culicoides brevitarsis]|uniref:cilia- and flagella-associated protein 299-like n=1 Tax=Culicoides brevitarsis TaxID=469753 RepID=UPI00307B5BD4
MNSTFTDFHLIQFNTYDDYLDSYVTNDDLRNLRSSKYARLVAELGYNATTEMLTKDDFEQRKAFATELLNPTRKGHELFSDGADLRDPLLKELADRERSNRVGMLSTIIFLRHVTKRGVEISGYIDFEWSLRMSRSRHEDAVDWGAVFKGKRHLWPSKKDLGYYNWKTGVSLLNDTENYKVISDPMQGLIFLNRHDRKVICPDPALETPGVNTTRTVILDSPRYNHCVLYDHVLRKMV